MSSGTRGLGWIGLLLLAACGRESSTSLHSEVGTLGLRLKTEVNDVVYRLREGKFVVTGPQSLSLSTEDDVDAVALHGTLLTGDYDIELLPGWRLERESASGFDPLEAELTSANPVFFTIEPGETTLVGYEFLTDSTPVELGEGAFEVSIRVTDRAQTPGTPACDFSTLAGCEELACERACFGGLGGFCLDRCESILACVSQSACSTEADPLCAVRTQGVPNFCTAQVDQAGGVDASNPTLPAFVARQLVECLCTVPRPVSPPPCSGCLISGACVAAGFVPGGNSCLICDPARSMTSFVAADGAACEDGAFCTVDDVCQGGVCQGGALRDCGGGELCDEDASECALSVPSFERDVWPIFQAQCTPCHTSLRRGGHSVGSPTLSTAFADAIRLGTTLIERLDGGGMPLGCTGVPGDPGCIPVADLATIQLWLDTGLAP